MIALVRRQFLNPFWRVLRDGKEHLSDQQTLQKCVRLANALEFRVLNDGLGQRVFGRLLGRTNQRKEFLVVHAPRPSRRHGWPTLGQRAGFIEHHRVHVREFLEELPRLDQQAACHALAATDRQDHRCGDAQDAGITHNVSR